MIGTYYTEDLMQDWFLRNLPVAKSVLAKFTSVNRLMDGFKDYEKKPYRKIRNAIMFLCLPRVGNGIDPHCIEKLGMLEKTIELYNILSWDASKLGHFKSRLTSDDYVQSLSAVTELEIASSMVDRFGKSNVDLYPKLKMSGFSDVRIRMDGQPVYIEVGNLGESIPESKIQQILNTSAKYLGERISTICYLCLMVDTAELIFDDKNHIDVDASLTKLKSEVDSLELHKLAGFEGFFDFVNMSYAVSNRELLEKMNPYASTHEQRLLKLLDDPTIKNWLSGFDPKLLASVSLIKGVIAGRGKRTLLVEIHTEESFPSKTASAEIDSFLNHIIRNSETQISEQQLQPNEPNIIAVKGQNWILSLFGIDELHPLYDKLAQFFLRKKEPYLSGIVVFGDDLARGIYINNPYARESSRLQKENVDRLGFRWLDFQDY